MVSVGLGVVPLFLRVAAPRIRQVRRVRWPLR
jgi:hypothetical protein